MSKTVNKRDKAKLAIIEIADHLGEANILVGARFIDAVQQTLAFLVSMPEIAGVWESSHPRLQGIRVWPVDGFPNHLLFYRPISCGIDLIFVCHATRDIELLFESL
jgi:toxin ParE1/3/4